MSFRILSLIAIISLLCAFGSVQAGEIVIIVNSASGISEATAADVSKLFRGKASSISEIKVVPVDQSENSPVRTDFSDKILGRSVQKMAKYWKKQVFAGKGEPPKMVSSDADVIEFIKKNKNAVGYISAGALTDDVKALTVDGKQKW